MSSLRLINLFSIFSTLSCFFLIPGLSNRQYMYFLNYSSFILTNYAVVHMPLFSMNYMYLNLLKLSLCLDTHQSLKNGCYLYILAYWTYRNINLSTAYACIFQLLNCKCYIMLYHCMKLWYTKNVKWILRITSLDNNDIDYMYSTGNLDPSFSCSPVFQVATRFGTL